MKFGALFGMPVEEEGSTKFPSTRSEDCPGGADQIAMAKDRLKKHADDEPGDPDYRHAWLRLEMTDGPRWHPQPKGNPGTQSSEPNLRSRISLLAGCCLIAIGERFFLDFNLLVEIFWVVRIEPTKVIHFVKRGQQEPS